jgi:SsrA-binding protein
MRSERELAQKSIAENRKAFHDYHILETFEAGVQLQGTEVKAIREGNVNLRDSYASVDGGEVWIYNVHINPYSHRKQAHDKRETITRRDADRETRAAVKERQR